MREVVGRSNIDTILTTGRAEVQVEALTVLENILAAYNTGIRIHTVQLLDVQPPPEVEAAFRDVASAREDKVRIINQAEAYRMKIVPEANGTALSIVNAARAYRQQVEQAAEGEAQRFTAMVEAFNKAKDITKKRMTLEAMSDVLSASGIQKVILSRDAQGRVLPLLSLDPEASPFRAPAAGKGATK
jgi:membrane protease subunit HflK